MITLIRSFKFFSVGSGGGGSLFVALYGTWWKGLGRLECVVKVTSFLMLFINVSVVIERVSFTYHLMEGCHS